MYFGRNGSVIGKLQYPSNIGLSYIANYAVEGSASSSRTFSSCDLGDPSPNRTIIVGIGARNNTIAISDCNIAGVTAYIVRMWVNGNTTAALAVARVPTGTTGDIVVSYSRHISSTTVSSHYIGVWSVKNLPHIFPMDTAVAGGGGTMSATLRTSKNGFAIVIAANAGGNNGPENPTTFSANLTKRFDGEDTTPIHNVGLFAGADGLTDGTDTLFEVTPGDVNTSSPTIFATWDCGDTGGIWHINSVENIFI